jgi:zinc and cadmium transporter
MSLVYALIATLIVSLAAVVTIIPFFLKKRISHKTLLFLLSVSVGTLLGSVFIHFLPEATSHGYTLGLALSVIAGFLAFFVIEKFVHYHHHKSGHEHTHHHHHKESDIVTEVEESAHSHAFQLAPVNLIGDALHNFIDGLLIAGSFMVSVPLGIAATVSILLHEVPQEIADFAILLYSGFSKKKAILFNFLSAASAFAGVFVGYFFLPQQLSEAVIPFTVGAFIYIAATNLTPQLHRHCKLSDTFVHLFAIVLGVGIMVLLALFGPEHIHV